MSLGIFTNHDACEYIRSIACLVEVLVNRHLLPWIGQFLPKLGVGSILKITLPALPPLRSELFTNMDEDSAENTRGEIIDAYSNKYSSYLSGEYEHQLCDNDEYADLVVQI
ncbi:MAG: hypothetical protein ACI8Z5_001269 [Lentimonas sp.]|jgi:hypothetical protein